MLLLLDHNLDHLQLWTTWEIWTLWHEKARKMRQKTVVVRFAPSAAQSSSPVSSTRKSLWSSTPHRDFSIECYKVAKKTPDGFVAGGNKIKMGIPVVIEGEKYKYTGVISNIREIEEPQEK